VRTRTRLACFGLLAASPLIAGAWLGCSSSSSNDANNGPVDPGGTFGAEVVVHINGAGHVFSSPLGLECPGTCFFRFMYDPAGPGAKKGVQLTAEAPIGWKFSGWQFNTVAAKGRAKGPESCQPYTRQTSVGSGDNGSPTITVMPGEVPATTVNADAICGGQNLPTAYDVTATFTPDPSQLDAGSDASDGGVVDQIFDAPTAGAVGGKIFYRSGRVYWQWDVPGAPTQSGISSGLASGGSRTDLVPLGAQITNFYVYNAVLYQNASGFYSMPTTGGAATPLLQPSSCVAIAGDTSYAYCRTTSAISRHLGATTTPFASGLPTGTDLFVDTVGVLYSDSTGGSVNQIPTTPVPDAGTPTPTVITTGQVAPSGVAAYQGSSTAVWLTSGGSLKSALRTSNATVTTLDTQTGLKDFAVDFNYVWYTVVPSTARGAASIWRVPVSGGVPVMIRQNLYNPGGIATDGSYVYWTDGDGRVNRAR
jgi:hypothetical protein